MRLIDADALSKKWQEVLDEKADEKGTLAYITFELFIDRLKEEPSIEAEPVKHGRWIDTGRADYYLNKEYRCSCCNSVDYLCSQYCYNCGTKMDDEPKEE